MIGIVDYGMGNLMSVYNAFDYLGIDVKYISVPEEIKSCNRIVIPGVGAMHQCMDKLRTSGFIEELNETVITRGIPTLGICLGMQVMANFSSEGGHVDCLGWFDAEVVKLEPTNPKFKVPSIGWNKLSFNNTDNPLFRGLPSSPDVYFVHSYHMKLKNATEVAATYEYGENITAAIVKNNIFATQFHPEKSQELGLKILENFTLWNP